MWLSPTGTLLLRRGGWHSRGPRENHSRPAIDPSSTQRRAPMARGSSGHSLRRPLRWQSGAMAIKTRGGVAIVQDPREAAFDSMPRSAPRLVDADHVVPAPAIAPLIVELSQTAVSRKGAGVDGTVKSFWKPSSRPIFPSRPTMTGSRRLRSTPAPIAVVCCGRMELLARSLPLPCRPRLRPGDSPQSKSEEFEAALWTSLRLLKEKATLTRQLANQARLAGNGANGAKAERIEEQAQLDERYAQSIHELLESMPNPADQVGIVVQAIGKAE